jgi:hypothetical protein
MSGRGIATLIGLISGVLIIVGGFITFLGHLAGSSLGALGSGTSSVILPIVTVILGFVVLWVSRPRLFWWPGRRTFNGILLVALGVITWIVVGTNLLVIIGSALAMLSGMVLVVEGFLPRSFTFRGLFRRL